MGYVDYERAWLMLKREIVQKKSHGQRDLSVKMAEIEVACEVEESGFDPRPRNGHRPAVGASREAS